MSFSVSDKAYLKNIFKSIFDKNADKKGAGGKELELFIQHRIDNKNVEESLDSVIEKIKTELLDNNNPYKLYIAHGNMKIFEILFYIISTFNVSEKIYFNVLIILLKFLSDALENDKSLIISVASTIIKLIRGKRKLCLVYFNYLFEGLIFLYIHSDKDIRNYGYALDELLKDEISNLFLEDYSTTNNNFIKNKNSNEINDGNNENLKFPMKYLLGKLNENSHPALKILTVSWIAFLESISEVKIFNYMNKIIPELFNLLCYTTKDVYQSSEFCLKKILCDIETQYESLSCDSPEILKEILETIIQNCMKTEENIKLCSFEWLEMFLRKIDSILEKLKSNDDEKKLKEILYQNTCENNFIKGNIIPPKQYFDNKNENKSENKNDINEYRALREIIHKNNKLLLKVGLMEINEKKKKFSTDILINNIPNNLFGSILNVLISNTSDDNDFSSITFQKVKQCNQIFKSIIEKYPLNLLENNLEDLEKILSSFLDKPLNDSCILLILEWTSQLYNQFESKFFKNEYEYIGKLVHILPENNKNIIVKILNTLCLICSKQPSYIDSVIDLIIQKLYKCQDLVLSCGITILKTLSNTIDIFNIFTNISDKLLKTKDINFVIKLTKTLNMFLLADKKCQKLRDELSKKRYVLSKNIENNNSINDKNKIDNNLFEKLFCLWAFNPFMTVLLTMYCNYFELSYYLTLELAKMKLQENDYIELCQIVQIFESSIFNSIRIKLIRPKKNIFLVKTLYALLMLLPQSNSFDALNSRIQSVKTLSNFDDDDDYDDSFYNEEEKNNFEISETDKKQIIDKYLNILKERYKMKNDYEKAMKQKKKLIKNK